MRRLRRPFLPFHRLGVEDGPDRPAAVFLGGAADVAVGPEARVLKPVGVVNFIPEPQPNLVHEDHVLKVADRETRCSCRTEHRAAGLPLQVLVSPPAPDVARLGDRSTRLARLARQAPQRRADRHRHDLAVATLTRPRLTGGLVFLGQARIEHPPELDVAGVAAGGDDHASSRLDVHVATIGARRDTEHAARRRVLADDVRHPVAKQELDALGPRAALQRTHKAGARASVDRSLRSSENTRVMKRRGTVASRDRSVSNELDAVREEKFKGGDVLVRPGRTGPGRQLELALTMVGVIEIYLIGRVLNAVLLLEAGAAAKGDSSPAQHRVTADVVVLFDDDHRSTLVASHDGGRKPRGAGADDHDVGDAIPANTLVRGDIRLRPTKRGMAVTRHRRRALPENPLAEPAFFAAHLQRGCSAWASAPRVAAEGMYWNLRRVQQMKAWLPAFAKETVAVRLKAEATRRPNYFLVNTMPTPPLSGTIGWTAKR